MGTASFRSQRPDLLFLRTSFCKQLCRSQMDRFGAKHGDRPPFEVRDQISCSYERWFASNCSNIKWTVSGRFGSFVSLRPSRFDS